MIAFRIIVNTVLHIRVHSNVLYYSISYMYVHVCVCEDAMSYSQWMCCDCHIDINLLPL